MVGLALSCKWNLLTVLMRVVDGRHGSTFLRTVAGPVGSHCSVQQVEGAGRIYNGEHDTLCTRRMDVSCGRRNYSCRILFLFGRTRFWTKSTWYVLLYSTSVSSGIFCNSFLLMIFPTRERRKKKDFQWRKFTQSNSSFFVDMQIHYEKKGQLWLGVFFVKLIIFFLSFYTKTWRCTNWIYNIK